MILDCTIRDGGYYNNWDFDFDLVKKYIKQIHESKVDCIEIGYRSLNNDKYYGPFYYCSEVFLNSLNIPKELSIAVMVDAKEIEHYQNLNQDLIEDLFVDEDKSIISLVRIASDLDSVINIIPAINNLKKKGYKVSLNLMKVTNISDKDLLSVMETLVRECSIDIFCIADSFGNLSQSMLLEKIKLIKASWNADIGVHLHNNQGRACPSALIAYNSGVDWIDTTVLGMGRGAGNASTERLMLDINEYISDDSSRYKPEKLFGIILNEFTELKNQYQWGYNLLYEISSRYSLHPNHVMELMTSRNRYSPDQMLTSMYKLIEQHTNIDLKEKDSVKNLQFKSLWNPKSYLQNKSVILLGPGSEGAKHSSELKRFIKNKKPVVISLNTVEYLPLDLVDIFAFLNEFRIVAEFDKIKDCNGKILVPANLVPSEIKNSIGEDRILHHPVKIESNSFESNEINSVIPYEIVFAYSISAILLGGPNIIYLYGFDGYPDGDPKQSEMLEILKLIDKANTLNVPICSITNSTYPILQKSIYGPQL